ncbi:MAG: hypothetical protein V4760_03860 [Bdellovibrionota bacterium]
MKRFFVPAILLVASMTMAPGFGRPATHIQVDRLIAQYEVTMDPVKLHDWVLAQVASSEGWDDVTDRADARVFKKHDEKITALRTTYNAFWMIDEADGSTFIANYFTRGDLEGGAVRIRADHFEIHSSVYKDGSILWAFIHPDGRTFSRKTHSDGSIEYSQTPAR